MEMSQESINYDMFVIFNPKKKNPFFYNNLTKEEELYFQMEWKSVYRKKMLGKKAIGNYYFAKIETGFPQDSLKKIVKNLNDYYLKNTEKIEKEDDKFKFYKTMIESFESTINKKSEYKMKNKPNTTNTTASSIGQNFANQKDSFPRGIKEGQQVATATNDKNIENSKRKNDSELAPKKKTRFDFMKNDMLVMKAEVSIIKINCEKLNRNYDEVKADNVDLRKENSNHKEECGKKVERLEQDIRELKEQNTSVQNNQTLEEVEWHNILKWDTDEQAEKFLSEGKNHSFLTTYLTDKFQGDSLIKDGIPHLFTMRYLISHQWPVKRGKKEHTLVNEKFATYFEAMILKDKKIKADYLKNQSTVRGKICRVFTDKRNNLKNKNKTK